MSKDGVVEESVAMQKSGSMNENATVYVGTPIKVRYGETDMMGVVYHANYLLYFEDARIDFLDSLGFSYDERIEQAGYMSPIHAVEIHYHRPLHYGEQGFVRTSVAKNLPMRTVYHQQVFRVGDDAEHDRPLVDALITVCIVERATFKPASIKRTFEDLYSRYEEIKEG